MKPNLFVKTNPRLPAPQNRNPDNLTDAQLETLCRDRPREALKLAADRLTDAQIAMCVATDPCAALEFAPDRLTDAQIETCRKISPAKTLLHAAARLTPEQLVVTAAKCGPKIKAVLGRLPGHPMAAALYQVIDRLDPKTAQTVKKAVAAAGSKK